jgi:ABC-2 type transport system ATP-binding protein
MPPTGQKASAFQTRLLGQPGVLDAVPEGGRVRFVLDNPMKVESEGISAKTSRQSALDLLANVTVTSVPPRFEDGFMVLLQQTTSARSSAGDTRLERPLEKRDGEAVVQVRDLVRRFGNFTAVDRVSFEVGRGEIFGLLGPNGAGKTTTFRVLCGLLSATSGRLSVAGVDLRRARASARQRIGYVAQKFSLYGQLSVTENLEFFASAYGLRGDRRSQQIDWALRQFELTPLAALPSSGLPGGYKQRLAMAAALLHEPEILFLDEPTSGADPLARREFWQRITALSEQGVSVIVTTHFMVEAEYCDRIAIMDAGRVLAQGTPAEVRASVRPESGREPTMEDAFIAVVEAARERESAGSTNARGVA